MLKIYGREDCQDCVNLKASLDANNVAYDFRNIGDSLHDMAVFKGLINVQKIMTPYG